MENQVMVLTSNKAEAMFYAAHGIAVLARADSLNMVLEFLAMPTKPVAIEVDTELLPIVQQRVHGSGSRIFVDALGVCDLTGVTCYRQLVRSGADLIQTDNLPKLVALLDTEVNLSPAECLFNWAERKYPNLFAPPRAVSKFSWPYRYRYYSATNTYLGISSVDDDVYYLDAYGNLRDVGPLYYWLHVAGCE